MTTEIKKAFISYSWSNPGHEDWVTLLANRLVQDGIDVQYDKWHLKVGHDKYAFMESMVTAIDMDRVLIVLDKKYKEKSDGRLGGVGSETLIITPEVYENVKQEKFIPVIAQLDEDGQPYIPAYLRGRMYIDLSTEETFEENYEKLLRLIFERPSLSRPKLGKPPSYLFDESPSSLKTSLIFRQLDTVLDKKPQRIDSVLRDFLGEFTNSLPDYYLSDDVNRNIELVGEAVIERLHQYSILRNDYVKFIDKLIKSNVRFDEEILFRFFESLPPILDASDSAKQSYQIEHLKLIIHELFLYTIAIGLKNNSYSFLEALFHYTYLIKGRYWSRNESSNFTEFRTYYDLIDEYYKKLKNQNYYSVHAQIIVSSISEISKELILNADLLCHYVAKLNHWQWFPITYIYDSYHSNAFNFISRLISLSHFEKVKKILGVKSIEDFKAKIIELSKNREHGYSNFGGHIPGFDSFVDVDSIGTRR